MTDEEKLIMLQNLIDSIESESKSSIAILWIITENGVKEINTREELEKYLGYKLWEND